MNKKLYYFLIHIFLYSFFYSIGTLGWAYLYIQGLSISKIVLAWLIIRLLAAFIGMPLSWKFLQKKPPMSLVFLGVLSLSCFLYVLPSALESKLYFALVIFFKFINESTYWPVHHHINRIIVGKDNISKGFGYIDSTKIFSSLIGFLLSGIGLQYAPKLSFFIATAGMFSACIPLFFISELNKKVLNYKPFYQAIFRQQKITSLLIYIPFIVFGLTCIIEESLFLFPSLIMAQLNISLVSLGVLLAIYYLVPFVTNIVLGHFEDSGNSKLFFILGTGSVLVSAFFFFMPRSSIILFIFFLSLVNRSWNTGLVGRNLKYVDSMHDEISGGFFYSFCFHIITSISYIIYLCFLAFYREDLIYYLLCAVVCLGSLGIMSLLIIQNSGLKKNTLKKKF